LRKFSPEVGGEAVNDLGSPTMFFLAGQDVTANAPIQQDEFPVNRQGGAELGGPHAFFEALEKNVVVVR
jgi:hypothetical protein